MFQKINYQMFLKVFYILEHYVLFCIIQVFCDSIYQCRGSRSGSPTLVNTITKYLNYAKQNCQIQIRKF
jgi:hypothetical protein